MRIRERSAVRSFQKLRHHQSNGRILNMIDYTNAAKQSGALFNTAAFNNVIFVKHNLRRNERDSFPNSVQVATKIFVPFDNKRLEAGGRSFFIEEPGFPQLVREFFQVDALSADAAVAADMRILEVLSKSPTLDPFVICERLRAAGIKANPELFAGSYLLMQNATHRVYEVFQPLLSMSKMATAGEVSSFAEQIWNVSEKTTSNPFLEALQIPRSEWVGVIFAWKALIYYDLSSQAADQRLGDVILRLKKIRVLGNHSPADQQYLIQAQSNFLDRLRRLRASTRESIQHPLDRLVKALRGETRPSEIPSALREMATKVSAIGADVMLFDQVASYFLYLFPENKSSVAFEELSVSIDNLAEILSFASGGERAAGAPAMAFG